MKILKISNLKNTNISTLYLQGKSNNPTASIDVGIKPVTVENLRDYKFAKDYYNHKLDEGGQMFNDVQLFQQVMEDEKAKKAMFLFFRERAEQELAQLNQKQNLTPEDKDKIEGMQEIIKAFPSQSQQSLNLHNPSIAFTGLVTKEQKRKCHYAIHGTSLACAAISGTMGEGAAIGADTWLLRGAQAIMFLSLQKILGVANVPSLLYMGRQYSMGSYIGVRGAQYLISWLGIGGHVASGGTASGPVTSAVRGVNATLSTAITEKMGWGYVKNYENDAMSTKAQLINTGIYAATMGIFKLMPASEVLDPNNADDVKSAIEKLPKEKVATLGKAMYFLSENIHLTRLGVMFVANLVQGAIMTQNMDEKSTKEYFKNIIKISLLNTVLYELFNFVDSNEITQEATETMRKLGEEIANDPEISKELTKAQEEVIKNVNLDRLSSHDFVKQFQDKEFLYNLAMMTSDTTYLLADKWRKRNHEAIRKASQNVNAGIKNEKDRSNKINNNISNKSVEGMEKSIKELLKQTRAKMNDEARSDFGMRRVAGYDSAVVLMKYAFIDPVKNRKVDAIPNLVIFYGPSGVGKTLIGQAACQSAGARYKARVMSTREDRELQKIREFVEDAKKQNRHTVIQLNEFDDAFVNNPILMQEFLSLIDNSVKNNNVTFFLTTNNPLLIDKRILQSAQFMVPMGPANKEEIAEIVKYYCDKTQIKDFDLDRIVEKFESVKPKRAYNNSQIQDIFTMKVPKQNATIDDVLSIIDATNPIIKEDAINKFEVEKAQLGYKEV